MNTCIKSYTILFHAENPIVMN